MKKIISAIMISLVSISAWAASAADSTAVFTVEPKMSCANCEKKIKSNLRFEKGIKSIATSVPQQTVTIVYNPKKTNVEAIKKGFAKIGYKAAIATPAEKK